MRAKVLPIILPPSEYRQLEQVARAQERDPLQQARWILRSALGSAGALQVATNLNNPAPRGPSEAG